MSAAAAEVAAGGSSATCDATEFQFTTSAYIERPPVLAADFLLNLILQLWMIIRFTSATWLSSHFRPIFDINLHRQLIFKVSLY